LELFRSVEKIYIFSRILHICEFWNILSFLILWNIWVYRVSQKGRDLNILENINFTEKCFRQKLQGFKRFIYWSYQFDLGWRHQGQNKVRLSIFFNGTPYFWFQNLIAGVESFLKRYKKYFFINIFWVHWPSVNPQTSCLYWLDHRSVLSLLVGSLSDLAFISLIIIRSCLRWLHYSPISKMKKYFIIVFWKTLEVIYKNM